MCVCVNSNVFAISSKVAKAGDSLTKCRLKERKKRWPHTYIYRRLRSVFKVDIQAYAMYATFGSKHYNKDSDFTEEVIMKLLLNIIH